MLIWKVISIELIVKIEAKENFIKVTLKEKYVKTGVDTRDIVSYFWVFLSSSVLVR
jgi:hypothetical protein